MEQVKLEDDDLVNIKTVVDDLIDVVVKFNGNSGVTEEDFANFRSILTFATFIVNGIMYTYGMDPCAGHDHGEDGDGAE